MSRETGATLLRWVLTIAVAIGVLWWLLVVQGYLGTAATMDEKTGLTLDPYGRAKETLAVVVPFLTLVLGYWFGAKGADAAKAEASDAKRRAEAIAAEAPSTAYQAAREKYPDIFGVSR